jgi:hypothetical protein
MLCQEVASRRLAMTGISDKIIIDEIRILWNNTSVAKAARIRSA